jgi:phenylalanyl-tRNA synthetase alpha chain
MGCGMLNPNVLQGAGFDVNAKGIALGMGIERIMMVKYRIEDIRLFYENDARFLEQFLKD